MIKGDEETDQPSAPKKKKELPGYKFGSFNSW